MPLEELGRFTLSADQVSPAPCAAWLPDVTEQLSRLVDLPANWDSYGARRVGPDIVARASALLAQLAWPETPRPSVVPTPRGGAQIEWHVRGIDLEIDFLSPERFSVSFAGPQEDEGWERELSFADLGPLPGAVAKLSR